MEAIGIIPARFAAIRFPGKVLEEVAGKPILQHVYERARKAGSLDKVIIATDDDRIVKTAKGFGAEAVMTSKDHRSGTDRLTEAVEPIEVAIVVNIQGDEPLIHPSMIDSLVEVLKSDSSLAMATLKYRIEDKNQIEDPNVVKVVTDTNGDALYFSRSPIPCGGSKGKGAFFKHIGIYAYIKDFLFTFTRLAPSALEEAERLEQLRVLENGFKIRVVETEYDTIAVDTPEDLEKLRKVFEEK